MRLAKLAALCAFLCLASEFASAGGPLAVGGPAVGNRPAFGVDGKAFTWNPAKMPISYRVDPGPMAVDPSGKTVIDHNGGVQRLQTMFAVWQGVATANISFTNAGALLPAGSYSGGDLTTAAQFNAVMGSCKTGAQNPIMFDANGTLMASLGVSPAVIGFTINCSVDATTGYFSGSAILMNGKFLDGVENGSNFELSDNQFSQAITHEMGHFLGLDHSQINVDQLTEEISPCDADALAGMPLMFPILTCQARQDAGLPVLSTDDVAWISSLYPNSSTAENYGTISGTIFFGEGLSAYQGANVIARLVDDSGTSEDESRRIAVSVVSGYLFTGNPGQSVTASVSAAEDNTGGSPSGSRNVSLIGYYQIPVPPGTYTVEVESVYYGFVGGSSVGPLDPPAILGIPEFWNQDESAFDLPLQRDPITVHAGDNLTGIDIILNDQYPRFDLYEDGGALLDAPLGLPPAVPEDVRA